MGKLKAKAKETAAELEAKKAVGEVRKAAKDGAKAAKDLAGALAEQVRESGLDERAVDLAEKLRESEAYGKTQAKGQELATLARAKMHEKGLDDRADALLEQVGKLSDDGLERLGAWLTTGVAAKKLGIESRKRSKWSLFLVGLIGGVAGYMIAKLTADKSGEAFRDDFVQRGHELKDDLTTAADRIQQDTRDVSAPASEKPLADKIRTKLGEDPRTSSLPRLNINVAEGTVFVRGPIEGDVDQDAIRDVIKNIPGVKDVDLQLT